MSLDPRYFISLKQALCFNTSICCEYTVRLTTNKRNVRGSVSSCVFTYKINGKIIHILLPFVCFERYWKWKATWTYGLFELSYPDAYVATNCPLFPTLALETTQIRQPNQMCHSAKFVCVIFELLTPLQQVLSMPYHATTASALSKPLQKVVFTSSGVQFMTSAHDQAKIADTNLLVTDLQWDIWLECLICGLNEIDLIPFSCHRDTLQPLWPYGRAVKVALWM